MEDETLCPARFFPRAAAYLLDRLIVGAALFLPRLVSFFHNWGSGILDRAVFFQYSAGDILWWALGAAYFIVCTACTGTTPGKRAMGLMVVTKTGEKPDWLTAICRETFGRYLSSLLGIGYLLCLADPERGALHDRICDTMVVTAPKRTSRPGGADTRNSAPGGGTGPVPARGLGDDWYAPNL